jgi:hypothetical protein
MKVKDLIEELSKFNQELELYECNFNDWEVEYMYYKYTSIPDLVESKDYNKRLRDKDDKIKNKYFVVL